MIKNEDMQEQTKRLRFKSLTNVQHSSGDVGLDKSTKETKCKDGEKPASLFAFLHIELTRGYLLEHDEERFSARREKVYSFIKIPQELEKFMAYGFFQCADSLLFVYTFLPLRFIMAFWSFFNRLFRKCFGFTSSPRYSTLKPAETCDVLKGFILLVCSILMCYIDTNMMYHLVKSQSVMKLYIFYNMLEVGDRLFSAFGQDTIDALFWTATEPRDRRREHLGVIPHLIFAMIYVYDEITLEALAALTPDTIKELIPKVGQRVLFLRCWRVWFAEYAGKESTDDASIVSLDISATALEVFNDKQSIGTGVVYDLTPALSEPGSSSTQSQTTQESGLEHDFEVAYPNHTKKLLLNFPLLKTNIIGLLKQRKTKDNFYTEIAELADLLHSLLVLFQATTLNVAFNSNNKSLLIIMMSNNFVELKGSVFKKFDKNNLFQVSCSDVRERLHLSVLLFIVVLQTMKEYMWKEERFWILAPDCVLVLTFEVIIDWVKHAFITRFNEIPYGVYREYTVSLAYDVAQTRQKYAFSDHSDLVARRMGFIPLPLGVVITRVLVHAVKVDGFPAIFLILIAYLCLITVRILVSIVILGKACDLIVQHQMDKTDSYHPTPKKEQKDMTSKDNSYSNTSPEVEMPAQKKPVILKFTIPENVILNEPLVDASVGAAAIFSNSAIDLNGVCYLNDKMNAQVKQESGDFLETEMVDVSRSAPDIKAASTSTTPQVDERPLSPDADGLKRRSESEPNLAKADEHYEEAT